MTGNSVTGSSGKESKAPRPAQNTERKKKVPARCHDRRLKSSEFLATNHGKTRPPPAPLYCTCTDAGRSSADGSAKDNLRITPERSCSVTAFPAGQCPALELQMRSHPRASDEPLPAVHKCGGPSLCPESPARVCRTEAGDQIPAIPTGTGAVLDDAATGGEIMPEQG